MLQEVKIKLRHVEGFEPNGSFIPGGDEAVVVPRDGRGAGAGGGGARGGPAVPAAAAGGAHFAARAAVPDRCTVPVRRSRVSVKNSKSEVT